MLPEVVRPLKLTIAWTDACRTRFASAFQCTDPVPLRRVNHMPLPITFGGECLSASPCAFKLFFCWVRREVMINLKDQIRSPHARLRYNGTRHNWLMRGFQCLCTLPAIVSIFTSCP